MALFVSRKLASIAAAAALLAGCGAHGFGNSYGGRGGGFGSFHPAASSSGWHSSLPPAPPAPHSTPSAPIARPIQPPSPPIVHAPPPPIIRATPPRPPPPLGYGYVVAPARPVSVVLDLLDLLSQGLDAPTAPSAVVVEEAPLPAAPPPLPADAMDQPDDPMPPAPDYYGADLGPDACEALAPGAPLPRGCEADGAARSAAQPSPFTPRAASGSGDAGSTR